MNEADYVTGKRTILEAIENLDAQGLLDYKLYADGWLISLSSTNIKHFVYMYGFDINSQASASIASDKVATYELLSEAGIKAVPHYLLSSLVEPVVKIADLEKYFRLNHSLVVKPNRGSRGDSVAKSDTPESSLEYINGSHHASWAASPFIEISSEIRLVVNDGKIVLAYEKYDPVMVNDLKMFNLNLGAKAKQIKLNELDDNHRHMALNAMQTIGLKLGAVDIIFDENNEALVLEINSGFSLEHYAQISPENRTQVIALYEEVISNLITT